MAEIETKESVSLGDHLRVALAFITLAAILVAVVVYLVVMFVSGTWEENFVIWGLLIGGFLLVNMITVLWELNRKG